MGIFDKVKDSLDWRKVKVLGGDIPKGEWDFNGGMMTPDPATGNFDCISLISDIKKVTLQTEDSVKDLGQTLGFALAGGVIFGPLGALAGYLASGNRKEVCALVELSDDRKFVAVMDQRIYQQMLGFSASSGL